MQSFPICRKLLAVKSIVLKKECQREMQKGRFINRKKMSKKFVAKARLRTNNTNDNYFFLVSF